MLSRFCFFLRILYSNQLLQLWELSWIGLLALYWSPALFALWGGQITIFISLFLLLHLYAALKESDYLAGLLLALSVLLKFSPLVFLGLWCLQKRWKIVVSCVLGFLLGSWISGWIQTEYFLSALLPHMMLGENHPANISIWGIYLTTKFQDPWGWVTEAQYQDIRFEHILFRLCIACGWVAVFWGMWKKSETRMMLTHYAMLVCSLLFLSPVTRIYDCVYLFPVLIIGYAGYRNNTSRLLLISLLFACAAFVVNLGAIIGMISFGVLPEIVIDKVNVISLGLLWLVFLFFQKKQFFDSIE